MKTGFICASGFNLVATATRGGKRLIAVVLGAKSSASRAVKAAQLFERGFGTDPLSWLVPSQGTVESLQPVDAAPLDMHEEVCSNNRRRQPTEDGEEGGEAGTAPAEATNGEMPIVSPWSLRGAARLTSGLPAGSPPVEVYTGPVPNAPPRPSPPHPPAPHKKPLPVPSTP